MDGLKVNGAGSGFFEYRFPWPQRLRAADPESVLFVAEVSAKQLYGKDRENAGRMAGDYMRGGGTYDPSLNPNAYPMTDERRFPSAVTVRVNDMIAGREMLEDDPADHRGILSWHFQKRDRRLREAGSYGTLLRVAVPGEALDRAAARGELVVRLEVDPALPGGLAIYGKRFGRYPLDPTIVFVSKP
jgi:predicted transcriptional regulator